MPIRGDVVGEVYRDVTGGEAKALMLIDGSVALGSAAVPPVSVDPETV